MQLEAVIPTEASTKGSVLIHQMKSLDYKNRQVSLIEKAPDKTIEAVTNLATIIIR